MKIEPQFAELLADQNLQLRKKFDMKVGCFNPMQGLFAVNPDDEVILFITPDNIYLIDNFFGVLDPTKPESMVAITPDIKSDNQKKFVNKVNKLIDTGKLNLYEWSFFEDYKWKPTGDGRYFVLNEKENIYDVLSLDEIDEPLKSVIEKDQDADSGQI